MRALLDFLYPQTCLFCESLCEGPLCTLCFELLEAPKDRCRLCASDELVQKKLCRSCLTHPPPVGQTLAALTYAGPAIPLIDAFRKSSPFLAKSLASFMLLALEELPSPDLLIPWPTHFLRHRPTHLLAEQLGQLLQRPVTSPLRERLTGEILLKKCDLADKRLLLVGDLLTSQEQLRHCSGVLQGAHPARIDVVVLCRSMELTSLELERIQTT